MLPIVAIVGRPNVGKSTLFNRLLGKQLAIVADFPGVTRDRHYADTPLGDRAVTLIDTGGFDPTDEDPMRKGIARGVHAALAEADVVVCVLDALHPPTEADRTAINLLRRSNAKAVFFANRADNPKLEHHATDHFQLGIQELLSGSALHGRNIGQLIEAISDKLPEMTDAERALLSSYLEADDDDEAEAAADTAAATDDEEGEEQKPAPKRDPNAPIGLALLGRPNAGKSSLLNRLSGTERALVDDRPGTTRDPVDAQVVFDKQRYRVIDTAGVRRRSKVVETVEAQSVMRALRVMGDAEVVVLLCDASEGLSEQDAKLLALAVDRGRPLVVGLNKIDLLTPRAQKEALQAAKDTLHFAPWVPVLGLSVKAGNGVKSLMRAVKTAHGEFTRRIATAQLNRFIKEVIDLTPPPSKNGRVPKIYYMTQVQTSPPLFVAICSSPTALPEAYKRFVQNQLRTAFGFGSIPMRVRFRAKRRRDEV